MIKGGRTYDGNLFSDSSFIPKIGIAFILFDNSTSEFRR